MWTYMTLDGDVLDLTRFSAREQAYLEQCQVAYRSRAYPWEQFTVLAEGEGSPLVQAAGGWVTRAVWEQPVFQAARDLENRLGMAQGHVGPNSGDVLDGILSRTNGSPATMAAAEVGVSLHRAPQSRCARRNHRSPAKPGGTRLVVSINSLTRWRPSPVRQAAGRRAGAASRATAGV